MAEPINTFTDRTARDLLAMLRAWRTGQFSPSSSAHQSAAPREQAPPTITYRNDSGEEIPPHAAMRVIGATTVDGRAVVQVDKPDDSTGGVYVVNGPRAVDSGKRGQCFIAGAIRAKYDSGTPAVGETWGPKEGQWTLAKDKPGFVVLGVLDDVAKLMLVVPSPPRNATRCNATLAEDYIGGSGTVKVNNVVPLDGASPVESETDELDVTIIFSGWGDADEDSNCKIEWNATDERWEMYQMDCGGEE